MFILKGVVLLMDLKDVLKAALAGSADKLRYNKDELVKEIYANVNARNRINFTRIRGVINSSAGGRFLEAKLTSDYNQRKSVIDDIIETLKQEGKTEDAIDYIVDTFVYALDIDLTEPAVAADPEPEKEDKGDKPEIITEASSAPVPAPESEPVNSEWECTCHQINYSKYCVNCGKIKSEALAQINNLWICSSCGKENFGNFCTHCGCRR